MQCPACGRRDLAGADRYDGGRRRRAARGLRHGKLRPDLPLTPRRRRPPSGDRPRRLRRHAREAGHRALRPLRRHQRGDGSAPAPVPRSVPGAGPHQRQRLQGDERRPRAGAPGPRPRVPRPRRVRAGGLPSRERSPLLPALYQGRRAGHPRADLLLDELRQRPALRPGPSSASRPDRHGFSTCTSTPPPIARSTSARRAPAGRCSSSSATR